MTQTRETPGLSTAAALLCILAAGCASVRGALLLLGTSALVLLIGAGISRLLRPLAESGTPLAFSLLGAALAAGIHMALLAWRPAWLEDLPVIPYYLTAFLAGALAAQSGAWEETLPHYGVWGAVLLVLGGIREWLAVGRLMGVQIFWDGCSRDFGLGGLGLLTAGLLLSVCRLRYRHSCRYTMRESAQAGGLVFLGTALAGIVYAPLSTLPLPEWSRRFLPAFLLILVFLILRGVCRSPESRTMLAEPALAAVGFGYLLWLGTPSAVWWQGLLLALGAALLAGTVTATFAAAAQRLDRPGLPRAFNSAPVLLITAGITLYAFRAFF